MTENEPTPELTPRVPLGGDYWEADPGAPLWGMADLHAHLMAHLAFGGNAFWGLPYHPQHPGPEGIQYALTSCEPIHSGLLNANPEFGHVPGGGWPEFILYPRFTTLIHQQAYIDWLFRAYQGGLRLITCLAVNNELLASKSSPVMPHDDRSAIQAQIAGMKQMEAFVASQNAVGKSWLQIVYSAEEARQVIQENRLAVLLGVEVDSLGNWHRPEDLEKLSHGDLEQVREMIALELDWLHGLGVRQITPIHLINNAFGGTAIYLRFLEMVNVFVTGERWTVHDAWESGVRYRIDRDGADLLEDFERTVAVSGRYPRGMNRRTLVDHIPGMRELLDAVEAPTIPGGHANSRGLNQYGEILLEEMMARGMVIDVDHMSEKSTDAALDLAEKYAYPVICSHTWFRDLLFSGQFVFDPVKQEHYGTSDVHKVAHEAGKRGDQIERIGRLGGIVAPILNQGDIAGLRRMMPELAQKLPQPSSGSSTSFAQAYLYALAKMGGHHVAFGSDINGAAGLPGPRFGVFASFGVHNDARRIAERRGEIDQQTNGVAYTQPIRDHRWYRFETSGPGGYDEEECDIWQAIAQYEAGFNPAVQSHSVEDFPDAQMREALELAMVRHLQEWVDHATEGFFLADQEKPVPEDQLEGWPVEKLAAYYFRKKFTPPQNEKDDHLNHLMAKMEAIWAKWQQMKGSNRPLVRSTAGPLRDFDINLDGMAHYGMLPDLLQDMKNSGLSAQDLAPLFRSAYDYIQMWDKCERRAVEITNSKSKLPTLPAQEEQA